MRQTAILRAPLSSADKVFEQEFLKGEGCGIELFAKIPLVEIERITADLENEEETENDE